MWNLFGNSPNTSGPSKVLTSDNNLRVAFTKLFKKEETVFVLLISNTNSNPQNILKNVAVNLTLPEHLGIEFSTDDIVRVAGDTLTVPSLAPRFTVVEALRLRHKKHGFNIVLSGRTSYRTGTSSGLKALPDWQISVELSDMLRPYTLKTDSFEKHWAENTQEKKFRIVPTIPLSTPKDLLDLLGKELSFLPVQVIRNEGIAAASFARGTSSDVCLLYSIVGPQGVDLIVRSKDKFFTEVLARQLHKVIR